MKKIVIGSVFLIALLIIYLIFRANVKPLEELDKKSVSDVLVLKDSDTLHISASSWGLAGNNEEIVLSKNVIDRHYKPNKKVDYIFYASEVFYKLKNDSSIILYAPESSINKPVQGIPNVVIKALSTASEIEDYNNNYQRYGLQRIRVY